MLSGLKSIVPAPARRLIRRFGFAVQDLRAHGKTREQVFSQIYRDGTWGRGPDATHGSSGTGSDAEHSERYVRLISEFLASWPEGPPRVVDLGCGDMRVGRQLIDKCSSYTGLDIVPELIQGHLARGYPEHVQFACRDIVSEDLPASDVCLVRQVFQHLSNSEILAVLPKLARYQVVFITEHQPDETGGAARWNLDLVHGSRIRLYQGSGVSLEKDPFRLPKSKLKLVLECPGSSIGADYETGTIRTYEYRPG